MTSTLSSGVRETSTVEVSAVRRRVRRRAAQRPSSARVTTSGIPKAGDRWSSVSDRLDRTGRDDPAAPAAAARG